MINVRQKGQSGEREIADALNLIANQQREVLGYPTLEVRDYYFQRNQNQSAVGGDDLTNPMKLSIEVKRQEQLSINTWWKQTVESAKRTDGIPVLIFRQNRKKWRVCMFADIPLVAPGSSTYTSLTQVRVELSYDDFKAWFKVYATDWLTTFK